MKRIIVASAGLCIFALLFSVAPVSAAPQAANFAGTWQLTMQAGDNGANGGEGGQHRRGGGAQSITIAQQGDQYKVTHKTPRGENTYDATVSGNTISWTEARPRRNGGTMNVQCTATLDGDSLKGTMAAGRFNRDFTATRSE